METKTISQKRILQMIGELNPAGAEHMVVGLAGKISNRVGGSYIFSRAGGELLGAFSRDRTFIVGKKSVIDLKHLYQLCSLIKEHNIDIIHSHLFGNNLYGFFAALATGRKIVFTIHGEDSFKSRKRVLFYKLASSCVSKIVAVSEPIYNILVETLKIHPSKVTVIINGVEMPGQETHVDPGFKKKELGIRHGSLVVVSVGNVKPVKGYDILIRAVEDMSRHIGSVTFLIAGGADRNEMHMEELQKMIQAKRLEERVFFLGKRNDIDEILKISDVYVLPSRTEGTSLSLLEAMAAGKPIVATEVGGTPYIIKDRRNGLLVPPENPQELSRGIMALLSDRTLARDLGANARKDFEKRYSMETMVDQYIRLYDVI